MSRESIREVIFISLFFFYFQIKSLKIALPQTAVHDNGGDDDIHYNGNDAYYISHIISLDPSHNTTEE